MQNFDLHTHTTYSDGKNSPEEMILSAINMGLKRIGISDHSFTAFDSTYCMKKEATCAYKSEILSLKEKYKEQIQVILGIEQDIFSNESAKSYDYVIGSSHYICIDAADSKCNKPPSYSFPFEDKIYIPIDDSKDVLRQAAIDFFSGDALSLCEKYFDTVAHVYERTSCDIIGHFDLITKFNGGGEVFDENALRYKAAWKRAADILLESNAVFEINYGAISRGYKITPYPSREIYNYLKDNGAEFIYSSDAHEASTIAYWKKLS